MAGPGLSRGDWGAISKQPDGDSGRGRAGGYDNEPLSRPKEQADHLSVDRGSVCPGVGEVGSIPSLPCPGLPG